MLLLPLILWYKGEASFARGLISRGRLQMSTSGRHRLPTQAPHAFTNYKGNYGQTSWAHTLERREHFATKFRLGI